MSIEEVYKMTSTEDLPSLQKILTNLHENAVSPLDIGTWTSVTTGTAAVQATHHLMICAYTSGGLGTTLDGLSDSANPPTTRRAYSEVAAAGGYYTGITFGCKRGDYFRVNTIGGSTPVISTFTLGG